MSEIQQIAHGTSLAVSSSAMHLRHLVATTLLLVPACLNLDSSGEEDPAPSSTPWMTPTSCTDGLNCSPPAIAVGGTQHFVVGAGMSPEAAVSGSFSYDGNGTVRALGAGIGTLTSLDHAHQTSFVAFPVAKVAIQPRGADLDHDLVLDDPSSFALSTTDTDVVVTLETADFRRLVDTGLAVEGAFAHPIWDVVTLPKAVGAYQLVATSRSFGAALFAVSVVDHVERIAMQGPTTIKPGDGTTACFHAYVGTTEVAIGETLAISGPAMFVNDRGPNCATYTTTGEGMVHLTATTIDGRATATFDVTVAAQ